MSFADLNNVLKYSEGRRDAEEALKIVSEDKNKIAFCHVFLAGCHQGLVGFNSADEFSHLERSGKLGSRILGYYTTQKRRWSPQEDCVPITEAEKLTGEIIWMSRVRPEDNTPDETICFLVINMAQNSQEFIFRGEMERTIPSFKLLTRLAAPSKILEENLPKIKEAREKESAVQIRDIR